MNHLNSIRSSIKSRIKNTVVNLGTPNLVAPNLDMISSQAAASQLPTESVYHEMELRRPVETNVLEELKQNLNQLEDLHFRLKYLMGEIGQHTRKKS